MDSVEKTRRKALRPPRQLPPPVAPALQVTFPKYLVPYACIRCRKSFKRKSDPELPSKPCPHCRGIAIRLYRHFKAPPMNDLQQWKKVAYLIQHGFRFYHQYDEDGRCVPYPETMAEAKEFVRRFAKKPTTNL